MKDYELGYLFGFIVCLIFSALAYNNFSISSKKVLKAIEVCKKANSELYIIYADNDFMCKNNSFFNSIVLWDNYKGE